MEEGWAAGYIGAGRVDCESERVKKRWLTSLTPHHPHDDTGRHNEWLRTIFIGTACTQVITGDSVELIRWDVLLAEMTSADRPGAACPS